MEITSYEDLRVWQKGINLVTKIYSKTQNYPKQEMYGLTSQTRRAAVSVPGNIAEGWGRNSKNSFLLFLAYSMGSLAELKTYNIIAKKLDYITEHEYLDLKNDIHELGKMIFGLQTSIKNKNIKKEVSNKQSK